MPGRTGAKTKTPQQRAAYLHEVAKLYVTGMPQYRIARELQRSPAQISYDLKALQKAWTESALLDFNAVRGQQLQRLDLMEEQLWEAWRASREEVTETQTQSETVPGPQNTTVTARQRASIKRKQRTGGHEYMALILNVCQERSKLCGLYPKDKDDLVAASGGLQMALLQRIVIEEEERLDALGNGITDVSFRVGGTE